LRRTPERLRRRRRNEVRRMASSCPYKRLP
jgi:hypothetical protein